MTDPTIERPHLPSRGGGGARGSSQEAATLPSGASQRRAAAVQRLVSVLLAVAVLVPVGAPTAGAANTQVRTVWAWGGNAAGRLGEGTTESRPAPAAVPGMGDFVALAAGGHHSLAVRTSDGTVWAWGLNSDGQLGDAAGNRSAPVMVPATDGTLRLFGIVAVGAGEYHSLALRAGGRVFAWGSNEFGQLGDDKRSFPVLVRGVSDVVAIAAGGGRSLALRGDGTVWAWGRNSSGQLGDGTTVNRDRPAAVSGVSDVVAIAAGGAHSLALAGDGSVWAWGDNSSGQLGDATTTTRLTPTPSTGLSAVAAIAAGGAHSLALAGDGGVWAWGDNSSGQLGDDITPSRSLPAALSKVSEVGGVAAGGAHSLALRSGAPIEPGTPAPVSATAGDASARVTWNAAPDGGSAITGYTVQASPGGVIDTVSGAVTATEITGLTNGTAYTFTVRASNDVGPGPVSTTSAAVTPYTVPGAPISVTATYSCPACAPPWQPAGPTVTVSWAPPVFSGGSAITGYRITRLPGGVTTDVGDVTAWPITGLEYGQSYTFTVSAVNARGEGPASAPSGAVAPQSSPGAPAQVTATAGDASARVSWTAPPDGGSSLVMYEVKVSPGGRLVEVRDGTATSATILGLTNGTDYAFEVRAFNRVGESPWSALSDWVTPADPPTAPGAPTDVSATAAVESATVRWTAPAFDGGAPISGYRVAASPGGTALTVGPAARQTTVTGLTAGTSYAFTVTAMNHAGEGPASAPSNAVKPAPRPVTALSHIVRFDSLTAASPTPRLELRWTKQGSPDAIKVTWSDGSTARSVTLSPAPSAHTVTGLTQGKAYNFQVRAVTGGVASTPASVTTPGSAVTSAVKPAVVTSGASTTVSGRLTRAGTTTPLAGLPVQLQMRTQNAGRVWSTWSNVGSAVRTSPTGTYAITHRTPRNARYRVVFAGAGGHLGSASPVRGVNVAPRVTASLSPTSMRVGSTARLTGTVSPNVAGKTVHLQRKVDGRWVDVRGASQKLGSTSTYSFAIKPARRGTYSYRVRVPAYAPYAQGFSPSRTLTIS